MVAIGQLRQIRHRAHRDFAALDRPVRGNDGAPTGALSIPPRAIDGGDKLGLPMFENDTGAFDAGLTDVDRSAASALGDVAAWGATVCVTVSLSSFWLASAILAVYVSVAALRAAFSNAYVGVRSV